MLVVGVGCWLHVVGYWLCVWVWWDTGFGNMWSDIGCACGILLIYVGDTGCVASSCVCGMLVVCGGLRVVCLGCWQYVVGYWLYIWDVGNMCRGYL